MVSVIIPCFNSALTLFDAVRSVLSQTYTNFEVIVVDDGSTDNTREIISGFEQRVRYLYQQNQGPAVARNSGINLARGEYIAFLDSDDLWLPNKIAKQVAILDSTPDVGMVYSDAYLLEDGVILPHLRSSERKPFEGRIFAHLCMVNFITTSSVLIRAKCIETAGYFDKNLKLPEDSDFWIRIAARFRVAYIDEPLVKYRLRPDSFSEKGRDRYRRGRIAILEKNRRLMSELDRESRRRIDKHLAFEYLMEGKADAFRASYWLACKRFLRAAVFTHSLRAYVYGLMSAIFGFIKFFSGPLRMYFRRGSSARSNSKPLKVLYLSHTAEISGGEVSLLGLLDHLDKTFVEPVVALPESGPLQNELLTRKVSVRNIKFYRPNTKRPWRFFWTLWRLIRLIQVEGINLIHANGHETILIGVLVSWLLQIPIITHIRLIYLKRTIYLNLLPWADFLICNSNATEAPIVRTGVAPGKIAVVHNGVDLSFYKEDEIKRQTWRKYFNISKNDILIGIVGRICEYKGHHILLEAMSKVVNQSRKNIYLAVIGPWRGDGKEWNYTSYWNRLEGLIISLNLKNRVFFTGFQKDMVSGYNGLDILAMPSRSEPFGRALIEAMAITKPVITSNRGGPLEIVIDRLTGLLVPPDDKDALAEALLYMIEHEPEAKQMGIEGRRRVDEKFSIEAHVSAIKKSYKMCCPGYFKREYLEKLLPY